MKSNYTDLDNNNPNAYDHSFKIILVGETAVGKSSMLSKYYYFELITIDILKEYSLLKQHLQLPLNFVPNLLK